MPATTAPPLLPTLMDLELDQLQSGPSTESGKAELYAAGLDLMLRLELAFPEPNVAAQVIQASAGAVEDEKFQHLRLFLTRLDQMAPWAGFTAPMGGCISGMAAGKPAKLVLAAHAVAACAARSAKGHATLRELMVDALRRQVPTEQSWRRLWEAQKRPDGENWLDHPAAWTREVLCAAAA